MSVMTGFTDGAIAATDAAAAADTATIVAMKRAFL
jgi:hypothetical protein